MRKEIEEIKQMVSNLRDSSSHVCPADADDEEECSCGDYDEVLDKLDKLLLCYI